MHQHHIRSLDGSIAADSAHGHADVGTHEHRRVVDAIAHKGQNTAFFLLLQQLLDLLNLISRQKACGVLSHAHLLCHGGSGGFIVAREHNRSGSQGFQARHGSHGILLQRIGNDNTPEIRAVLGHIDHGSHRVRH